MIRQLKISGFKDQVRTVELSGLDLITSDNINGVGKSAVLEAFKLALIGEIPGRARNVEAILNFTSRDEMKVEIVAETGQGSVVVERSFLRHALSGDKRPIRIDQVPRKYEEGSEWIRQHIGAVSISFDPFEFLNLSDCKKRQWIITHSPESHEFNQTGFYLLLLSRMVEHYLGSGIVHSLMLSLGVSSLDEVLQAEDHSCLNALEDRLIKVFRRQEPLRFEVTEKTLASAFHHWSVSESSEHNSNALLAHLKAEVLRLKNALRQLATALSCMGPVSNVDATEHSSKITDCREQIGRLNGKIRDVSNRLRQIQIQADEKIKRDDRMLFLQQNIARLNGKLNGEVLKALADKRDQWKEKLIDLKEIQQERNRLGQDLAQGARELREMELSHERLGSELKMKRDKQRNLGGSQFSCPVDRSIRCETDMIPYRENLIQEIESLTRQEVTVRQSLETTRKKTQVSRHKADALDNQLDESRRTNRETQREIDLVEEQIQADEKARAQSQGLLKAYLEEWTLLESQPVPTVSESCDQELLESEKIALKKSRDELQNHLDEHLRQQGRVEALSELKRNKKQLELELEIVGQVMELILDIQEGMASCVAGALEREVNDILRLIDRRYEFILNFLGGHFEMGWNRDGKVIPFNTMNSAHFVLFIVPFLAALVKRLADVRAKKGLPTLKALCIEAESLTPGNLQALLQGLAKMKAKGNLDNVLVAHYHSLSDPDKLWGFQQHIIKVEESLALA